MRRALLPGDFLMGPLAAGASEPSGLGIELHRYTAWPLAPSRRILAQDKEEDLHTQTRRRSAD